uniref:Uncharacterized protein n=1 Tax=Arundo donax TaxID=35708 RepID=A0A0A9D6D2_ARUDO
MLLKCFSPSSTRPEWPHATRTAVNVKELGLTPSLFIREKSFRASSGSPWFAYALIMALQETTPRPCKQSNTSLA